ncbi:hypothetical protein EG329_004531 [Mollisiaceae sp. DMI_Dod_QoI]|nr:hypothetical protein EG329_004531 [Helotiales sp. DMI_Dod_QoI]
MASNIDESHQERCETLSEASTVIDDEGLQDRSSMHYLLSTRPRGNRVTTRMQYLDHAGIITTCQIDLAMADRITSLDTIDDHQPQGDALLIGQNL